MFTFFSLLLFFICLIYFIEIELLDFRFELNLALCVLRVFTKSTEKSMLRKMSVTTLLQSLDKSTRWHCPTFEFSRSLCYVLLLSIYRASVY